MTWKAKAPSNIALINTWVKSKPKAIGRPIRRSRTRCRILSLKCRYLRLRQKRIRGSRFEKKRFYVRLSPHGEVRFLKFFAELKKQLGIKEHYLIQSANTSQ